MASPKARHLRVVACDDPRTERDAGAPQDATQSVAQHASQSTAPLTVEDAFRAHARFVASIALRLLGRPSEVDDLVQDVFLRVIDRLDDLRNPAALRSWLAVITARLAHRRLRARRWRVWLGVGADYDYTQLADGAAAPDDRALLAELYRALDQLPVGHRIAWGLRRVEGLELAAIARACDCSLATAKRRIASADAALRAAVGTQTETEVGDD